MQKQKFLKIKWSLWHEIIRELW